ncbi:MAG: molybdopterin biosynthesis protein [Candidatus Geothermarchaeales archaeon]
MSKLFKELITIEEAQRLLQNTLKIKPPATETVDLYHATGRVLAEDILSPVDVPPFDRASMDGYAIRAEDSRGAGENQPVKLRVVERIETGKKPSKHVHRGEAAAVGTGAPVPGGANAVVMVEYTEEMGGHVYIYRGVVPGENIQSAGADVGAGEAVLRRGEVLTPREIGLLAAIGRKNLSVYTRPRVALLSIGDEITPQGATLEYGKIYDVNGPTLFASLTELGAEPIYMGVVGDDPKQMEEKLSEALTLADVVLTSGSTSAGTTDVLGDVLQGMGEPGVIAHGLKLKPGKPTLIAVVKGKPVFGLPGYPTSALMVFRMLVEPTLRALAGQPSPRVEKLRAKVRGRVHGAEGRRRLVPVSLRKSGEDLTATPVPGGSGAITSLAKADGYLEVPSDIEYLEEGEEVPVVLLSPRTRLPDVVVMGSHCRGVDLLAEMMVEERPSLAARVISVGSLEGLLAVKRGEADIAGINILDEKTGRYNIDVLRRYDVEEALLIMGYEREQGLVVAKDNPLGIKSLEDATSEGVRFINRNRGSGIRELVDLKLGEIASKLGRTFRNLVDDIEGYETLAKTHSSVVAAVAQGRADLGVAIRPYVEGAEVDFIPIGYERLDFLIRKDGLEAEGVKLFLRVLASDRFKGRISRIPGLRVAGGCGEVVEESGI